LLEQYLELVEKRDDLTIERVSLLNLLHRPSEAMQVLKKRKFHPWEGGEGKVTQQYVLSLVELARKCIKLDEFAAAVEHLQASQSFPHNLGEGKLYGAQENNSCYYLGCAYEGLGERELAEKFFKQASEGLSEPTSAMFYNDQPPDMIFYQGLARQKLGNEDEAAAIFRKLIEYGQTHVDDIVKVDYFAISLPDFLVFDDDLQLRNQIHCHYMMALGHTGLGEMAVARPHFDRVRQLDINHLGAELHGQLLD
jgi:tetratricopeptide (TPR) repeat protein